MKKYLLSLGMLLGAFSANHAIKVTLPAQDVLSQRLREASFEHFVEKTDILSYLAGQEKETLGVIMAVELALYDYGQNLKNPMIENMMQMKKPQLIEILLKDSPEAAKEAQNLLKEMSQ